MYTKRMENMFSTSKFLLLWLYFSVSSVVEPHATTFTQLFHRPCDPWYRPNILTCWAWDEMRFETELISQVTLQWLQMEKKNIRLTPRIFAIPVKHHEERMKELGLQGSTNSKWFQVLIISFKCPAPCTSPHIFCGWHSHRTPPCHQPGKAVIMSMTMSSYYDTMTSSGLLDSSFLILTSKMCAIQTIRLYKKLFKQEKAQPQHITKCVKWSLRFGLCSRVSCWASQTPSWDEVNGLGGSGFKPWSLLKGNKMRHQKPSQKRKIHENSDFSKRPSPCPWLPHYRPRTCATWKPKHWWIRHRSKKIKCLVAQQKNNLPQITDILV